MKKLRKGNVFSSVSLYVTLLQLLKIELEPRDGQRLAPGSVPFNVFVLQGFMVKVRSHGANFLRARLQ